MAVCTTVINDLQVKMQKAIDHMIHEFGGIRTGKASPTLVENIKVEYYGVLTPLKDMAAITTPEARMIVIQPWDVAAVKEITKAIQASSLGVNPLDDGKIVRVVLPELSQERRKELEKKVKGLAEDTKVSVRNIRRDGMESVKKIEKEKKITEDDLKIAEKDIQDLTDKMIKKIDEISKKKEQEILTV